MYDIQTFNNPEFGNVRTVSIDGEPWLVGRDVAAALGYSNVGKAVLNHVDEEDRRIIQNSQNGNFDQSAGNAAFEIPNRGLTIINESGLYSLVLSSRLPGARRFRRWVTSEVLPSIRRHGLYAMDEILADPDSMIAALTALKAEREERRRLEGTVAVQTQQILEMKPKASYYDVVLNCKDLVAISVIAKDFGWSATKMNQYLHEKGVQYKQGHIWLLYQKYAERGFTSTKTHSYPGADGETHTKVHTYWTQAGRLFIYDLMKANGYIPLIERESAAV